MPRLRVMWQLYLWINLFCNQVLTAVCFTSGEKKPSNQWEKWGKNLVTYDFIYLFYFFKEQLMYMPIGHWFYFTEWFKNNEPKSSWVCFKKLAKLSFISKLSFVFFLNLPSKAKCISVYIKISTYCYTSQLFLCKLKFWDPCFMDNQNKFFSCGNGQLSMFDLAGF